MDCPIATAGSCFGGDCLLSPVIKGFIAQLTLPDIQRQIEAAGRRQIDVTLYASGGRAILEPTIVSKVFSQGRLPSS